MHENPNYIRIRVKDVPCSADDGQITRYLEKCGCVIHNMHRECLRIDGYLTNCQTGDRIYMCDPPVRPIPRYTVIGKYKAAIFYRGQIVENKQITCNKCLEQGHISSSCPNDWKCKQCLKSGHKQSECRESFSDKGDVQSNESESDQDVPSSEDEDEDSDDDTNIEDSHELENVRTLDQADENSQQSQSILQTVPSAVTSNSGQSLDTLDQTADETQCTQNKGGNGKKDDKKKKRRTSKSGKKKDISKSKKSEQWSLDKFLVDKHSSNNTTPLSKVGKRQATTPTSELHDRANADKPSQKTKS